MDNPKLDDDQKSFLAFIGWFLVSIGLIGVVLIIANWSN